MRVQITTPAPAYPPPIPLPSSEKHPKPQILNEESLPEMSLDSIPWILVTILVIVVLLAVVMVVRKRKQPRRLDYRNYFVMGVVWLATGVFLLLLPWFLHEEVSLSIGGFFLVMGVAYTILGLVNREKWGKQVEVPATTTRNMMIAIIVLAILVVVVWELLVLYR
jgi:formate hydrogenlyase subunit 3/multisubunit Na+/H+ antiporter MnhD subunit